MTAEVPEPEERATAGGIHIGSISGSTVAVGAHAKAVRSSIRLVDASPELIAALQALHEELTGDGTPAADEEVAAQVAETTAEIETTGRVRRDRLQWLRERIETGTAAATGLTAASQAVEHIARLIGRQG